MDERPVVVILAGPNGAGKSTMSRGLFGGDTPVRHYVNADTIARGLSAFHPEDVAFDAARIMLDYLRKLQSRKQSFAFETTLATKSFAPWLRELKSASYCFRLFFLWLPTSDMAVQRVRDRVRQGGHHVPHDTVRRRYGRGIGNFFTLYRALADEWKVYDNSKPNHPVLIAQGSGTIELVIDRDRWNLFREAGNTSHEGTDQRE